MDDTDKLILFELLQDCRQPLSKIAKVVKLSQQRVHYRIKKLEQDKVIKKYTININYPKLGYSRHSLYLDLKSIDGKEVDKIIYTIDSEWKKVRSEFNNSKPKKEEFSL